MNTTSTTHPTDACDYCRIALANAQAIAVATGSTGSSYGDDHHHATYVRPEHDPIDQLATQIHDRLTAWARGEDTSPSTTDYFLDAVELYYSLHREAAQFSSADVDFVHAASEYTRTTRELAMLVWGRLTTPEVKP